MRRMTDEEREVFYRLRQVIAQRRKRNRLRTRYFDGEEFLAKIPMSVPMSMRQLAIPVGWPRKAVDALASRLVPRSFTSRTSTSLISDLEIAWEMNSMDFAESQAITSALLHGCSFAFTSHGDPVAGEPEVLIAIRDATTATCELDPRTRAVTAALDLGKDTAYLHLPHAVLALEATAGGAWQVNDDESDYHDVGRVFCAPYVHGASLQRPLGTSRITRPLMGLTDLGVRTFIRQEVSSDFYAAPRGLMIDVFEDQFDLRQDGNVTGWEHMIGAFAALSSQYDEETDQPVKPELKVLPQMSMQPFSDQFRLVAAAVAGETSVPVHYLGVVQDSNPTSAEAIYASEVDLVRAAKGQFASFNLGRRKLAQDVLHIIHGAEAVAGDSEVAGLSPRWEDPRTRSVSEQSQFVALQVQAGNMQPGTEATLEQLPLDPVDVRRIAAENRQGVSQKLLDALAGAARDPEAELIATSEAPAATRAGLE